MLLALDVLLRQIAKPYVAWKVGARSSAPGTSGLSTGRAAARPYA